MKVYTISGGIGSGKSIVCKIFESLNVPVFYADQRAKVIVNTDIQLRKEIKELFGKESYDQDSNYNAKFVASQVFGNPQALKMLNELIHPKVQEDFEKWLKLHKNNLFVLKEAAILTKEALAKSKVIYVTAPAELRIQRVLQRDSFRNVDSIKKIMENQFTENEYQQVADFVIVNDGVSMIIPQVLALHKKLSGL